MAENKALALNFKPLFNHVSFLRNQNVFELIWNTLKNSKNNTVKQHNLSFECPKLYLQVTVCGLKINQTVSTIRNDSCSHTVNLWKVTLLRILFCDLWCSDFELSHVSSVSAVGTRHGFLYFQLLWSVLVYLHRVYCITHSVQQCWLMCTDEKWSCPQITELLLWEETELTWKFITNIDRN